MELPDPYITDFFFFFDQVNYELFTFKEILHVYEKSKIFFLWHKWNESMELHNYTLKILDLRIHFPPYFFGHSSFPLGTLKKKCPLVPRLS